MRPLHIVGRSIAIALCVVTPFAFAKPKPARSASHVLAGPGSLVGVWSNISYKHSSVFDPREAVLRTVDGTLPPLQPWAAKLLEQRVTDGIAGKPFANTKSQCLPSGVPQLMFGPSTPIQILETPGQITLLIEEFNFFRIIRLGGTHEKDPDPGFMGDSVGHWEGDTLVVDTIGLSERTTLDVPGMPHSDQLHVVERFRRASKDRLEVLVTMDDPKTFTKAWSAKAEFKLLPGERLTEYFCENQRDAPVNGVTTHGQVNP